MARSPGTAWGNWLVKRTSGLLDARLSRRSFIARTTLLGTAVAASGCAVITQPGTPYQSVAGCSGGECTDGYTEFCCVINDGLNACPSDSTVGGWWLAAGSIYCGGGPRYYVDCNQICCGPEMGDGFCAGCQPCRCAVNCDTRRVYCNYFRYGQCSPEIAIMGPIACRMVLCVPPYPPYTLLDCSSTLAEDDSTANHTADCPAPTPPPPPLNVVAPSAGAAVSVASNPVLATRGADGALWYIAYNGSAWGGWTSLGGEVTSDVVGVTQGANAASVFAQSSSLSIYSFTDTAGSWSAWNDLGGQLTSDPSAVVDQSGATWVFARGTDYALWYVNQSSGGWASLGGRLESDPSAAVDHSGNVWVFLQGTGGDYWSITRTGSSWGGMSSVGGQFTSDPAAVVSGTGALWVFGRGTDNALWGLTGAGPWQSYGGDLTSDPVTALDSTGAIWVFAQLSGGTIGALSPGAVGWTPVGALPSGVTSFLGDPAAVLAGSTLWVFALGSDNAIYAGQYNGSSWGATTWQYLGGVLVPVVA